MHKSATLGISPLALAKKIEGFGFGFGNSNPLF
jgi:hypothetical protein